MIRRSSSSTLRVAPSAVGWAAADPGTVGLPDFSGTSAPFEIWYYLRRIDRWSNQFNASELIFDACRRFTSAQAHFMADGGARGRGRDRILARRTESRRRALPLRLLPGHGRGAG